MSLKYKIFLITLLLTSFVFANKTIELDSIPPDSTEMRDITSIELAKEMIPGWNVGNSLEAIGGETAWGNPLITQQLIDSVKAAGFKSVRIPVAWSKFSDTTNFIIKEEWFDRVEEVVNYVLQAGMYAIINEHWDSGWQQPTYEDSAYVNQRLAKMWQQIAVYFRDYNDSLLFAGTNEIMIEGNYNTPTKEYYTVQNSFNQTFITTVRATGGRNTYRHLIVQGFNTNINHTVNFLKIPQDPTSDRMMVEVHYYDPYNFTINTGSKITQWGKYSTDPTLKDTWGDESYADNQFRKMKTKFIDKGYPVILGEYGVLVRNNLGSDALNQEYEYYRKYYINYITASIVKYGLVPVLWDNGSTANHGMGVFNRSTGEQAFPEIINAIMDGVDQKITPVANDNDDESFLPKQLNLEQNYPNPFNPTTTIAYNLPKSSNVTLTVFDVKGKRIETLEKNKQKMAGHYDINFDADGLASGIYLYKILTDNYSQTRKMLMLK